VSGINKAKRSLSNLSKELISLLVPAVGKSLVILANQELWQALLFKFVKIEAITHGGDLKNLLVSVIPHHSPLQHEAPALKVMEVARPQLQLHDSSFDLELKGLFCHLF